MRVLIILNLVGCRLGQIGTALEEAGAEVDILSPHQGEPLPASHANHDGIVIFGGTQNALADDACPWLPGLVGLMRSFVDDGRSVLGICLGSQLLARACGAENIIGGASEFGWQQVGLTADGQADPLFEGVPAAFPIFQWHDDTFRLPKGAMRLAANETVENQAFRVGRAAYGVQFHFEANRGVVSHWNEQFAEHLATHRPQWAEQYPHEAERFGPEAEAVGLTIARNWVRTIGA